MMNTYVVALDLTAFAQEVLLAACQLAQKTGAKLHLLHSVAQITNLTSPEPTLIPDISEELVKTSQVKLQSLIQLTEAKEAGVTKCIETVEILNGDPSSTIIEYAQQIEASLIIIGYRGQNMLERFIFGSTAQKVASTAETSVLVYRPGISLV